MGIVVDVIIVLILALSIFLGYRKGLVSLAIKLCAFIIAVAVTFVLYRPIGNLIINTTGIDETIENSILDKVNDIMASDENNELTSELFESARQGMLPEASREVAINIVYGAVILILYIVTRVLLRFVTAIANWIAKLPILNQFNKIGGIIYGALRGVLVIYVVLLLINVFGQINPNNSLHQSINESYVGKAMYNNNVLNVFFN